MARIEATSGVSGSRVLAWLGALTVGVLSACSDRSVDNVPTTHAQVAPDCSLVLYGDSILHGAYVEVDAGGPRAQRWVNFPAAEIAARRPAYAIDDRTVSGQSLSKMSAKFKSDKTAARIVVLGNGIAEAWSGESVAATLQELVNSIRQRGGIPIITGYSRQLPNSFMTPDKLAGRDRGDGEAREVSSSLGVVFADFGAAGPIEIADDVHPTQAYSLRLTDQLIDALDKAAPECGLDSAADLISGPLTPTASHSPDQTDARSHSQSRAQPSDQAAHPPAHAPRA